MEIINSILDSWYILTDGEIEDLIESCQSDYEEEFENSIELEDEKNVIISKQREIIEEIYDFMDYIGVAHDKLTGDCNLGVIGIQDKKIEEIERKIICTSQRLKSYQKYRDILSRMKEPDEMEYFDEFVREPKDTEGEYNPYYEFCIDIYILQHRALSKIKKSKYEEWEYHTYIEILELFSVENMIKVGHPKDDNNLKNGNAEYVAAICRCSWARHYLKRLSQAVKKATKLGANLFLERLKIYERANPIVLAWIEDSAFIEHKGMYSEFSKKYYEIMTHSEEAEINDFISCFFEE